jgi:hypothetical protein
MTELEKPTMVGKYHEENLNNPETNQVAVYHNKDGKSRIGKITDVGDTTVKIEGRFDIPKEDLFLPKIVVENEVDGEKVETTYHLHKRWLEHLLKNKFEYKPGKVVKFFLSENGEGIFINKLGYKDVNYYGRYFEEFLTEIRSTNSNSEAKALFFKHNYKVVRVPQKREE